MPLYKTHDLPTAVGQLYITVLGLASAHVHCRGDDSGYVRYAMHRDNFVYLSAHVSHGDDGTGWRIDRWSAEKSNASGRDNKVAPTHETAIRAAILNAVMDFFAANGGLFWDQETANLEMAAQQAAVAAIRAEVAARDADRAYEAAKEALQAHEKLARESLVKFLGTCM